MPIRCLLVLTFHCALTESSQVARPPRSLYFLQLVLAELSFLQCARSEVKLGAGGECSLCSTCSPVSRGPRTNGKKTCAKDHLQWKNKSGKKDLVDFAEWGNGVQLPRVLVTDAFSSAYLANLHIHLNPPVA